MQEIKISNEFLPISKTTIYNLRTEISSQLEKYLSHFFRKSKFGKVVPDRFLTSNPRLTDIVAPKTRTRKLYNVLDEYVISEFPYASNKTSFTRTNLEPFTISVLGEHGIDFFWTEWMEVRPSPSITIASVRKLKLFTKYILFIQRKLNLAKIPVMLSAKFTAEETSQVQKDRVLIRIVLSVTFFTSETADMYVGAFYAANPDITSVKVKTSDFLRDVYRTKVGEPGLHFLHVSFFNLVMDVSSTEFMRKGLRFPPNGNLALPRRGTFSTYSFKSPIDDTTARDFVNTESEKIMSFIHSKVNDMAFPTMVLLYLDDIASFIRTLYRFTIKNGTIQSFILP